MGGGHEAEFRREFKGTRCFVENLSFDTDWVSLKDAFASEGYPIVYASVSTERDSGRSKGHGVVQFETVHAAEHAMEQMTGFELDGRLINVRPDYQERDRRENSAAGGGKGGGQVAEDAAVLGGDGNARREAWKNRAWTRVAGSGDGDDVDEDEILAKLLERDTARQARDFGVADGILDELVNLGVGVDDARRQRVWWLGRRAEDSSRRSSRGPRATPGRRSWFDGGREIESDDDGGGKRRYW